MQLWAIGTTRNEVDLVAPNFHHHLGQGVDKFLIRDNGSTDGTQDVLSQLQRHFPLEWSRYHGPFRQDLLLTELAREALRGGADWVIPIDADEFWHGRKETLRSLLEHSSAGALEVDIVNFVQNRDMNQTTPKCLLQMNRRVAAPVGASAQWEELVETDRIAYVEHRYPSKWLCRPTSEVGYGWGSHTVSGVAGPHLSTSEILCFHAPLRSYAVLEAKVEAERPFAEVQAYVDTVWQLRRWRRLKWEGRLEKEWEANSYRDDCLDVFGQKRPLVVDNSFSALVEPWIRSPM